MIKQAFTYTDLYACAFALYLICHTVGTSDNLMDKNDWLIWGCVALCYATVRCLTRSCQYKLLGIIAIRIQPQQLPGYRQFQESGTFGWLYRCLPDINRRIYVVVL